KWESRRREVPQHLGLQPLRRHLPIPAVTGTGDQRDTAALSQSETSHRGRSAAGRFKHRRVVGVIPVESEGVERLRVATEDAADVGGTELATRSESESMVARRQAEEKKVVS